MVIVMRFVLWFSALKSSDRGVGAHSRTTHTLGERNRSRRPIMATIGTRHHVIFYFFGPIMGMNMDTHHIDYHGCHKKSFCSATTIHNTLAMESIYVINSSALWRMKLSYLGCWGYSKVHPHRSQSENVGRRYGSCRQSAILEPSRSI